jgi:hypothetical protein
MRSADLQVRRFIDTGSVDGLKAKALTLAEIFEGSEAKRRFRAF